MKLSGIFITRAKNLRQYPSRFSRILVASIPALVVLNFDFIDSGRSVTEGNYLFPKVYIFLLTQVVIEYVYRVHLWCTKRYGFLKHGFMLFLHQTLLGVIIPEIFIWQLLRLIGITYLPYIASLDNPDGKSIAMIHETLALFNLLFLFFYFNIPQTILANTQKIQDELWVRHFGIAQKERIDEVLAIIHLNGVNFLVLRHGAVRTMMSQRVPDDLIKELPKDVFERRGEGLYRTEVTMDMQEVIIEYIQQGIRSGHYS